MHSLNSGFFEALEEMLREFQDIQENNVSFDSTQRLEWACGSARAFINIAHANRYTVKPV